jgi:hypothetical protein
MSQWDRMTSAERKELWKTDRAACKRLKAEALQERQRSRVWPHPALQRSTAQLNDVVGLPRAE